MMQNILIDYNNQKCPPFTNLPSRLPTALILSYIGYEDIIQILMRKISHRAKMYLRRENYLKGFLIEFDIIKRLKMADESGILLQYTRWQVVDIDYVVY